MLNFNQFISNLVLESLHPELLSIVKSTGGRLKKQTQLAKKIKELTEKGESTGIEGNMPKGSSRAYLQHKIPNTVTIDEKKTTLNTGTKVAIRADLDKHHRPDDYTGLNLGAMQNEAENGDHWVNSTYRILSRKHDKDGHHFESNEEGGIFPPLLDHDEEGHEWSHVGHVDKITKSQFKQLTKTEDHPKGISHDDFCNALERHHNRSNGRYHEQSDAWESHLDSVENHPLVQKFIDYHGNTGNPPHDYRQIGNLGRWKHPLTGQDHIVARDHGFSSDVQHAYTTARKRMWSHL